MKFHAEKMNPFGVKIEAETPGQDVHDLPMKELRELFRAEQFVLLRGFAPLPSAEAFAAYCERWGEISVWPFGKVLELVERENPEDHIFDNNYVPLHWDGMYRPQVPEYQIFHCASAPLAGQGGRTTFSHTPLALKNASPEERHLWERVTGTYQRKMEYYDSKTIAPIVTRHPLRDFSVIRYNEPPRARLLNPPGQEFVGVSEYERAAFHESLVAALYAPGNFYAHEWQTGDIVVADNFSLLHGREGFTSRAPRHLRRVHVLSDPPLDNPHLVSHQ